MSDEGASAARSSETADFVEALMARLSLEDKIGQLNMPIPNFAVPGTGSPVGVPETIDALEDFVAGEFLDDIGPGGGVYMLAPSMGAHTAREAAELSNRLQRAAATRSPHAIPLLNIVEGCHGVLSAGHTVFPEGLALGSTWNLDLVRRVYSAIAREARATGVHMLSTLVVEPIRDPRLGRNCEGYTEDPYLLSQIAEAIVGGAQGESLASPESAGALLTCFPAQSEGVSGRERGAMEVSERTLRDVFLPAWEAGLTRAGAVGVMAAYVSVDGHVTHGSEWLLTELLREELAFEGITFSEGRGFLSLMYEGVAENQSEAGALAIRAGVDVNITYEEAYLRPLAELVRAGEVAVDLIDRAVRRVLTVKHRLGLFDEVFVDPDRAAQVVHCPEHVDVALEAAREGIVVLENRDAVLPLSPDVRVAVVGPNAARGINQLGDYTMAMAGEQFVPEIVTVLDGIRAAVDGAGTVTYAEGCDVVGDDRSGFAAAVAAAAAADVAVVVVGEQQGTGHIATGSATVGEQADAASLDLSGVQEDLVRAVHATGTPTVVVLINGRPLSVPWAAEHVAALVEAWQPGEVGGRAVADVLFGRVNPSGRLAITIPRSVGQLPVYYNHRWAKSHIVDSELSFGKDYVDLPASPLYSFGHGLSYTEFEYTNLQLSATTIQATDSLLITVDVTNVGARPGVETVQLYLRDVLASLAPKVKQLRGFVRLNLEPGQTATAVFDLAFEDLAMYDARMAFVVEPGEFEVQVGSASDSIHAVQRFVVISPTGDVPIAQGVERMSSDE